MRTFLIDCLPECATHYRHGWAVAAVDVIRATTMAVTAAALGRRCYPVESLEAAFGMRSKLRNPLLAGELNGDVPAGFEMNNSPAELAGRDDTDRPLVLLSSSGTRLITNAGGCDVLYLACFRNSAATSRRLIRQNHARIALLGAGSRGEFREEDQICCAWIGRELLKAGYAPGNRATKEVVNRWANAKASDCLISRSVDYLRRTSQLQDLDFILERTDDLNQTFVMRDGEVTAALPVPHGKPQTDHMVAY